ncbi:resistance protein [Aspergillus sclerotialis]|uniref:Resistance protein n=1 Tax=Aspergillus sclerotialis TaxID=2070753 RepID=A0A3A3A383_9EURO|nr:resistance protein [Aspergillus sclerotialis]
MADQVEPPSETDAGTTPSPDKGAKDWRFWAVFPALCMTTFLSALDTSILFTALPTIAQALQSETLYVWTVNSYLVTCTATQPIVGQTANIFGRRWLTILSVIFFALGSGISGGANNTAMLIGGRAVQGIGAGGINTLIDIVISDLVPLRERGNYVAIMGVVWTVGSVVGPVIGGAFAQNVSWRWVFYINLPLCGVSLVLLLLFLRVKTPPAPSVWARVKRIDVLGNTILIASVVSVLIALTWGGTVYPWASWHTLVPLLVGAAGMGAFLVHQASPICPEPTMPLRLFSNRTSAFTYLLVFIQAILLYEVCAMLPVYFQAVLQASPTESGVYLLPVSLTTAPLGIAGGLIIAKTGHYRSQHYIGYSLMALGIGLLTMIDQNSPTGWWVGFQMLFGAGTGLIFPSTLPAIQAALPETDVATATATWAFIRSFGSVWGVAIPVAVFNDRVNSLLHRVSDPALRRMLSNGGAYGLAGEGGLKDLFNQAHDPDFLSQVTSIYVDSLKRVWQVALAFVLLGVVLCIPIKGLVLRTSVETEFGLEEKRKGKEDEVEDAEKHAADSACSTA